MYLWAENVTGARAGRMYEIGSGKDAPSIIKLYYSEHPLYDFYFADQTLMRIVKEWYNLYVEKKNLERDIWLHNRTDEDSQLTELEVEMIKKDMEFYNHYNKLLPLYQLYMHEFANRLDIEKQYSNFVQLVKKKRGDFPN